VVHTLSVRFKSFNMLMNYLRNNVHGTLIIQSRFIKYMIFVIRWFWRQRISADITGKAKKIGKWGAEVLGSSNQTGRSRRNMKNAWDRKHLSAIIWFIIPVVLDRSIRVDFILV